MAVTPATKRPSLRSERGAELIEMALVLPVLLLVITGIFDFGFLFRNWEVVTNAAREGARAGILMGYEDPENVRSRVQAYLDASGVDEACTLGGTGSCVIDVADTPVAIVGGVINARSVTVTLQHDFLYIGAIAALVGGDFDNVTLVGRAVMRTESQATP